ncbi:methionine aminopeptidase [Heyndrickxia vini]|uniref:methionine aminopeptidase n=1 Tax=Heyndrickxia vini TaxID=1476025 RepID=UPI001FE2820B|nr:methionine aminopeptidase [Heyndrickxia vini]
MLGLFNTFQEWKANRYEEKIAKMESKGICPDCYGKGINSLALSEFYVTNVFDCPGCNGSGLFSDWSENNR